MAMVTVARETSLVSSVQNVKECRRKIAPSECQLIDALDAHLNERTVTPAASFYTRRNSFPLRKHETVQDIDLSKRILVPPTLSSILIVLSALKVLKHGREVIS